MNIMAKIYMWSVRAVAILFTMFITTLLYTDFAPSIIAFNIVSIVNNLIWGILILGIVGVIFSVIYYFTMPIERRLHTVGISLHAIGLVVMIVSIWFVVVSFVSGGPLPTPVSAPTF
jgi:hypothetical protein